MVRLPSAVRTLGFVLNHPLNRSRSLSALKRFATWQIASRILNRPVILPFVDDTVLVISSGSTGATGNWYCGLHEYTEMSFVLRFLREEDLFVDVGANVGTYTVLAAGAVGAETLSFEPIPQTFRRLVANVRINGLSTKVDTRQEGVSDKCGELKFTIHSDTQNHVVSTDEAGDSERVSVVNLDSALEGRCPQLIKIDVEGQELPVLKGAHAILSNPKLSVVIAESNDCGNRYGYSPDDVVRLMASYGFSPFEYSPKERRLYPTTKTLANLIFVRDLEAVTRRLDSNRRTFRLCNGAVI